MMGGGGDGLGFGVNDFNVFVGAGDLQFFEPAQERGRGATAVGNAADDDRV